MGWGVGQNCFGILTPGPNIITALLVDIFQGEANTPPPKRNVNDNNTGYLPRIVALKCSALFCIHSAK